MELLLYPTLVLLGAGCYWLYCTLRKRGLEQLAAEILQKAELQASSARKQADLALRQELLDRQREAEAGWFAERRKIQKEQERLQQREDKLEQRMQLVDDKLADLEKREAVYREVEKARVEVIKELEHLADLTHAEARELLMQRARQEVEAETNALIRRSYQEAQEQADQQAKTTIATAIMRLAVPCVSEATITTVAVPNDEIKGRVIGREGRNIRTLERLTGVNILIDDTPGAIVLSSFDPIRKQIAKSALTELMRDGRIHPTRIEEAVEKARIDIEKITLEYGRDAAIRAGAAQMHPQLLTLLGRLKFRYSYGQNILEHSLEVSHLLGLMAAELGLDVQLAKRIGLLHDMGKALSHEVEGSHATIGHEFALKHGESPEVANGIGCHHGEMQPITIEGSLCGAADALSASRPGARVEAVEEYLKRLKRLEQIAYEFPGVDRAYAMQAGREIQISVLPDQVDDEALSRLTRDITRRIEADLTYPGKIKVSAIREKRATQYAV